MDAVADAAIKLGMGTKKQNESLIAYTIVTFVV